MPFPVTASLDNTSPAGIGHTDLAPECRDRVRAALLNSGELWPQSSVRLSIADVSEPAGIADLAAAVSILAVSGEFRSVPLARIMFVAELGLDGSLRSVQGTWAALDAGAPLGITYAVVPHIQLPEFGASTGVTVLGAPTLSAVLAWLRGTHALPCAGTHQWDL
ncbi:magnesium chelatase domain-containing protein [Nocardia ninae]|uniref:magnesium chelatase domain-containing protein n=1 Tax=Nocardia ninae TaxID=356145 RepID=UPI001649D025|nr:magnesium chelatase domain-containing protein [Nocardia ninae]